jgi:N-methylhydantoinase A/oxoprolinase/acetone carboxylase beta subunit
MTNKKNDISRGVLGIDAGGTFTDIALVCSESSEVIAAVKTPTNHADMVTTIENGLKSILDQVGPEQIQAINLATTHATNAIVENKIRRCGLIVIGYDPDSVEEYKSLNKFGTDLVYQVAGGHDPKGNELNPFDEQAFIEICKNLLPDVESIAVSSYFSVRNPSHELRAKEIISSINSSIYVTCGHEIASDLNALKRATTAALNAGLIPIVMNLLDSVEKVCQSLGLYLPITIVRGDGTLVNSDWARMHPIETVLSGPAASAIGAGFLSTGLKDCYSYVVDIGGTTTDIILLNRDGKPTLGTEGTTVGGHKTLVKSIDIFTLGLGGDSHIRIGKEREINIGPKRVRPLCSTAAQTPGIKEMLHDLVVNGIQHEPLIVFPECKNNTGNLSDFAQRTLDILKNGPCTASRITQKERSSHMAMLQLDEMEQRGFISYAGFTPTDALHVLGRLDKWDAEASKLGVQVLLNGTNKSIESFCSKVCSTFSRLVAGNVLKKNLIRNLGDIGSDGEAQRIIDLTLSHSNNNDNSPRLDINASLIGLGAPSWAFIKEAADAIYQKSTIPDNAGVGGAVGAAVGTFSFVYVVLITPLPNGLYRSHLPTGVEDFECLDMAIDESNTLMQRWTTERAQQAGAVDPFIKLQRKDEEAIIAGGTQKVHLFTELLYEVTDKSASGCNP